MYYFQADTGKTCALYYELRLFPFLVEPNLSLFEPNLRKWDFKGGSLP
jgi:hypothetical protein